MRLIYKRSNKKKPALFLDRDGVINKDKKGKYILSKKDIKIYKSAVKALKYISRFYDYHLIILTNQSAVGRGMISLKKAIEINNYIVTFFQKRGVWINAIYFCPHKPEDNCPCRKPNVGLIEEAQKDFKIDFKKSLLVGDKASDIELGKKIKIKTVLVKTGQARYELTNRIKPDFIIKNLLGLKKIVTNIFALIFIINFLITRANALDITSFEKLFPKKISNEIEIYEYEIYWGFLNVGSASIEFGEVYENEHSTKAYRIIAKANSNQFIDNFYKVRDLNISYLDINFCRSYGYLKDIKEGNHEFKEYTIFDYKNKKFYGQVIKKGNIKEHQGRLDEDTFDALSSLFLVMRLIENETKRITINITTKTQKKIDVINHGVVSIKINDKKIKAYKLEPKIDEEAIFIAKKGKSMYVYISTDEKIPLMLEAEVFIGAVKAILKNYTKRKN